MPPITRRRATAIVLLAGWAGIAGLASCRGRNGVTASGTTPDPTTTTLATTPSPSTTARPATTARPTSTSSGTRPTSTTAGRPKVVLARQGDQVFAVFVATGSSLEEPSFGRAIARLQALGYTAYSGGDTGCSRGAKEALPQLGQYAISVEFATRSDADRFAALYGQVIGIAKVTVYCAD